MERHGIDETSAFEMLRERSRIDNRKLIDLATAVVDGHRCCRESPGITSALGAPGLTDAAGRHR